MKTNYLGERLKIHRQINHLTQKQVAEQLNVDTSFIAHCESGKKVPSKERLIAFSKVFGVPIQLFLYAKIKDLCAEYDVPFHTLTGLEAIWNE